MAGYDWNGNGRRDMGDRYIEYQIYKKTAGKDNYTAGNSGGISTFGAIIAAVGGLLVTSIVLDALGEVENMPVIFIIILWVIFGTILASFFESKGI